MNIDPQALRDLASALAGYGDSDGAETVGGAADTIDALRAEVADLTDERDGGIQETLAAEENYEEARAEVARLREEYAALRAGDDAVSIAGKVALMKARAALREGTDERPHAEAPQDLAGWYASVALTKQKENDLLHAEVARLRGQADDLMSAKDDAEREVARLREVIRAEKVGASADTIDALRKDINDALSELRAATAGELEARAEVARLREGARESARATAKALDKAARLRDALRKIASCPCRTHHACQKVGMERLRCVTCIARAALDEETRRGRTVMLGEGT